jgi:maltose alpha-D-glucosyltransferase/alpha-amylase
MLDNDPLWYKDAIIYEAHVRAFADASGEGRGDFRGLTSKLDYLHDLGVTAIWVLPFYPSPLRDDGYDIADYTSVHPQYGQLRDFQDFLEGAHRHGMRVITELVINHTSDQHPWFQRARRAPPGSVERNFYVWSDTPEAFSEARIIFKDFERSNWAWDPVARAYYWHRFYSHQPDLNYDNPAVWDAIFPVVDFWLGMGVDGLRLDAVPYLYEREGTNCENLPETHAFLQALRKHVDERFANRMLLAEANQWPEDALSYFGTGNESHMCFHFPIMPRLFMAVHREDRFPILDILAQTPSIPDNCQWCLFLRNHDELTLEMVTDEERDYMYRAYAHDPQARINLGIRRRLAPLMRNDRRRIELLNALLFALPGTPVVYYGDEIGMGDNIYLGDRNAVRTPMQWSADRNAGFSRANPQKLYLPVIIDPEYHYESLNVEAQQNNPTSLLWWMKRLIALRKQHKAFGRGSLEALEPDNPKVLAFLRHFEGELVLVVANLSRFVQHVELDLHAYRGLVPEELFGRSLFPPITDRPYPLTLGPHNFYWFALVPAPQRLTSPAVTEDLPEVTVLRDWTELFDNSGAARLAPVLLAYLRHRHAGGRSIKATVVQDAFPVTHGDTLTYLVLVRVELEAGPAEVDLLPLTFLTDDQVGRLLAPVSACGLARLRAPHSGVLVEALADPMFCLSVLGAIVAGRTYTVAGGELSSVPISWLGDVLESGQPVPVLYPGEQGNTSVIYGGRLVLKVFRRLAEGTNPELELGRFLTERQGFTHAPPVLGAITYRRRIAEPITLAVLHRYVAHQGHALQLTLDRLSAFYERVLALSPEERHAPHDIGDLSAADIEVAQLLGQRTAEMHLALGGDRTDPTFAPERWGQQYQRPLYQAMRNLTGQACFELSRRLGDLPESARALAERVAASKDYLRQRFRGVLDRGINGCLIRLHGDYQLANLLWTGNDFVIIDFEGNPTLSIAQRRLKRSPLRDVATFLFSVHQAVHAALYGLAIGEARAPGMIRAEDRPTLEPWAHRWYQRVSGEVLSAYFTAMGPSGLLPENPEARQAFLDLLVLERALESTRTELARRSEQVLLPLLAVAEMLAP